MVIVAKEQNTKPTDQSFDIGLETVLQVRFRMLVANHKEDQFKLLLKSGVTGIGWSDAEVHSS